MDALRQTIQHGELFILRCNIYSVTRDLHKFTFQNCGVDVLHVAVTSQKSEFCSESNIVFMKQGKNRSEMIRS